MKRGLPRTGDCCIIVDKLVASPQPSPHSMVFNACQCRSTGERTVPGQKTSSDFAFCTRLRGYFRRSANHGRILLSAAANQPLSAVEPAKGRPTACKRN
jgi:hypothetical protein